MRFNTFEIVFVAAVIAIIGSVSLYLQKGNRELRDEMLTLEANADGYQAVHDAVASDAEARKAARLAFSDRVITFGEAYEIQVIADHSQERRARLKSALAAALE